MKPCKILFQLAFIGGIGMLLSCDGGEVTPEVSETDLMKEKLAKTWVASSASSSITVDNDDVTSEFSGFTLTLSDNLSFTSNSNTLSRTPTPWPTNGTFSFGGTSDSPSLNQLIRDDGLTVSVTTDGSTMRMTFVFSDSNKDSTGGKVGAINGNWVFQFSVQ